MQTRTRFGRSAVALAFFSFWRSARLLSRRRRSSIWRPGERTHTLLSSRRAHHRHGRTSRLPLGTRARLLRQHTYMQYRVQPEYQGAKSTVGNAKQTLEAGETL
jgi:hypothetical protein